MELSVVEVCGLVSYYNNCNSAQIIKNNCMQDGSCKFTSNNDVTIVGCAYNEVETISEVYCFSTH